MKIRYDIEALTQNQQEMNEINKSILNLLNNVENVSVMNNYEATAINNYEYDNYMPIMNEDEPIEFERKLANTHFIAYIVCINFIFIVS